MATCSNTACGGEIAAGDVFCGHCGMRQDGFGVADTRPGYDLGEAGTVAGPLTSLPAGAPYVSADAPPVPPAAPPAWPGSSPAEPAASAGGHGTGSAAEAAVAGQPAGPAGMAATDALLGEAAPNAVYLGQRLLYERGGDLEELDSLSSSRWWREWLMHTGVVFIVWFLGGILLGVVSFILALIARGAGVVIGILLGFGWALLMLLVWLLRRIPGQISEWKFQVDGKGAAAETVFDHITWSFQQRGTPVDSVAMRRFRGAGELLEIRQGIYYGLVTCFANGNDLYVGWTLWLYQSFVRVLWGWVLGFFWQLRLHGNAIYASVLVDHVKALRESLHSAVREGADVAAGRVAPHGQGTIGSAVPVVTDDSLSRAPWISASQASGREQARAR